MEELVRKIESDEFSAEFYLASNTTSLLCQWLVNNLTVRALESESDLQPNHLDALATHATTLFCAPVPPGYRSEHEAAICSYAYVFIRLRSELSDTAAETLAQFDEMAGAPHGALRRLLNRLLGYTSSVQFEDLFDQPRTIRMVESRTDVTLAPAIPRYSTGTWVGIDNEVWSADQWLSTAA